MNDSLQNLRFVYAVLNQPIRAADCALGVVHNIGCQGLTFLGIDRNVIANRELFCAGKELLGICRNEKNELVFIGYFGCAVIGIFFNL